MATAIGVVDLVLLTLGFSIPHKATFLDAEYAEKDIGSSTIHLGTAHSSVKLSQFMDTWIAAASSQALNISGYQSRVFFFYYIFFE